MVTYTYSPYTFQSFISGYTPGFITGTCMETLYFLNYISSINAIQCWLEILTQIHSSYTIQGTIIYNAPLSVILYCNMLLKNI